MQGVLAQAKNGDQLFWEQKFHAPNGKAEECTQGALFFFLLREEGGGVPICSLQVPNGFLSGSPSSQCVPEHFLHSTALFIAYALANVVLLSPI